MDQEQNPLQRISILVEDTRLQLRVPRDHEALHRRAGEEIARTLLLYKAKYPNASEVPSSGYLAMTAVDIATRHEELIEALQEHTQQTLPRLRKVNLRLEELIRASLDILPTQP